MVRTENIYLDHAAGTDLLPEVKQCIMDWTETGVLNPSSIHKVGRESAALLDESRSLIAKTLGAKPSEILITSGGTEANNLAILGVSEALQAKGRHVITCATEHPSVLESCKKLESRGFHVSYLNCDENGDIDLEEFRNAISEDTILATFMWVNNETGLVHQIEEMVHIAHEGGVHFHCDAVQALGHTHIQLQEIPIDSLAISGHKLGTIAGVGALFVRKGQAISRRSFGGSQEQSVRSGTQNHLGATTLSVAIDHVTRQRQVLTNRHLELIDILLSNLADLPGIQINRSGRHYSPHILNCSFNGLDGEALFIRLDMADIAVSNGSACSSGSQAPSHVLTAMGLDSGLAQASLRISLGAETNKHEIETFCQKLRQIVHSLHKETN